jgi:glucose/arabinose dehydrogenase
MWACSLSLPQLLGLVFLFQEASVRFVAGQSSVCGPAPLPEAVLAPGFCSFELPVNNVGRLRSLLTLGPSSAIALERVSASVVYLSDQNGDDIIDSKSTVVAANNDRLTHGIALFDGYLYASSSDKVYRWIYQNEASLAAGQVGQEEVVIFNMNDNGRGQTPGGHTTRTLIFDESGRLYVSVGSDQNVDPDSFRSRIRRFELSGAEALPLDFTVGEVFADGLRNEVGLQFDRHGVLWGVENGADNLQRDDLGGDITNDNPAEELNRFREEDAGKNWGYPLCWSEFLLPEPYGQGAGTVWAWPNFLESGEITDEQCRATTVPSVVAMQAHSAPLGLVFYEWKDTLPDECDGGAFPKEMDGYVFIAFHGSWNRDIPTGYKVVYIPMDDNGDPLADRPLDLFAHEPPNARWSSGLRPVDVAFDACGRLLVTSDGGSGALLRVDHVGDEQGDGPTTPPSPAPLVTVQPVPERKQRQPTRFRCRGIGRGNDGQGGESGRVSREENCV